MAKRVYEIARELSIETKEVIERLRNEGIEVKNHFAVVEEPVYQQIFSDGQATTMAATDATVESDRGQNGRTEAGQAEVSPASDSLGRETGEIRRDRKGTRKRR